MSTFTPDMFQHDWLAKTLGIEFPELTPERVVATMPITPAHHQPFGYLHGGASVALAETAASFGGMLNAPAGKMVFGLEINANHVRARRDGLLTAIGTPLHIGQTTQVWEVKIYDEAEKLVCASRCTLAVIPVQRDERDR
jgi:1,4-dihydroxy-2-naphthoyl-CoA hydrolase